MSRGEQGQWQECQQAPSDGNGVREDGQGKQERHPEVPIDPVSPLASRALKYGSAQSEGPLHENEGQHHGATDVSEIAVPLECKGLHVIPMEEPSQQHQRGCEPDQIAGCSAHSEGHFVHQIHENGAVGQLVNAVPQCLMRGDVEPMRRPFVPHFWALLSFQLLEFF